MRNRALCGSGLVLAAVLLAAAPGAAQGDGKLSPAAYQIKLKEYTEARRVFAEELAAYWKEISDKRRIRIAKRRTGETIVLEDYVLMQPPSYRGPPRPHDPAATAPTPDPTEPRKVPIPVAADFLKAAAEEFGFVPQPPENELAFKRAYAKAALAAGLTKDQVVRIYAFETGGNGTYDVQAGLEYRKANARAISPAIGYNQLLTTNSIGLLAEHGERFVNALRASAKELSGEPKKALEQKIDIFRRMIAFTRTVPNQWNEHDNLAKTTNGGLGIHAAIFDRDIGPLLQVQKLVNSVRFARSKGYKAPLTAAELELMNFTGDGNGIDMVMMPPQLRQQVPTSNFFQQNGYERNPIARRTATVAGLIASIDAKMDDASRLQGAKDLAASF